MYFPAHDKLISAYIFVHIIVYKDEKNVTKNILYNIISHETLVCDKVCLCKRQESYKNMQNHSNAFSSAS